MATPLLRRALRPILIGMLMLIASLPATDAPEAHAAAPAASELWRTTSADLAGWHGSGTTVSPFGLTLGADAKAATDPYGAGKWHSGNYYTGGAYRYGEAVAPYHSPPSTFDRAVVSWNADTPAGTWVALKVRALIGSHWTREYVMGVWARDTGTVRRHSVDGQSDADGTVETDTLMLTHPATAYQVRAVLFAASGVNQTPTLRSVGVTAWRANATQTFGHAPGALGTVLDVPKRSQMIYPDGGENWCSPTSSSMVLAYWGQKLGRADLNQSVPSAAANTLDWIYDGNGNWAFNAAYVASFGLEAYVARLSDLAQVEAWTARGLPIIASISYKSGALPNSPIPASNGHLLVIIGFTPSGDVVTNDPAASSDQAVRITYPRAAFQQAWQGGSDGAVYLIFPRGTQLPTANAASAWPTQAQPFTDPAFADLWNTSDRPVATHTVNRSWVWGPQPNGAARLEAYTEAPAGLRSVQYFDKSRMEITRPDADRTSRWFVTNGLLTVELVSGRQQTGDSSFVNLAPANIPVAGDLDSSDTPTYATYASLATLPGSPRPAPNRTGQTANIRLSRAGSQTVDPTLTGASYAHYEDHTGHNVPNVFWQWMNDPAAGLGDPLFVLGLPISEPYWVETKVGGQPRRVLVQLYERRTLTYTPDNDPAWRVEMGNIGLHYVRWRYGN